MTKWEILYPAASDNFWRKAFDEFRRTVGRACPAGTQRSVQLRVGVLEVATSYTGSQTDAHALTAVPQASDRLLWWPHVSALHKDRYPTQAADESSWKQTLAKHYYCLNAFCGPSPRHGDAVPAPRDTLPPACCPGNFVDINQAVVEDIVNEMEYLVLWHKDAVYACIHQTRAAVVNPLDDRFDTPPPTPPSRHVFARFPMPDPGASLAHVLQGSPVKVVAVNCCELDVFANTAWVRFSTAPLQGIVELCNLETFMHDPDARCRLSVLQPPIEETVPDAQIHVTPNDKALVLEWNPDTELLNRLKVYDLSVPGKALRKEMYAIDLDGGTCHSWFSEDAISPSHYIASTRRQFFILNTVSASLPAARHYTLTSHSLHDHGDIIDSVKVEPLRGNNDEFFVNESVQIQATRSMVLLVHRSEFPLRGIGNCMSFDSGERVRVETHVIRVFALGLQQLAVVDLTHVFADTRMVFSVSPCERVWTARTTATGDYSMFGVERNGRSTQSIKVSGSNDSPGKQQGQLDTVATIETSTGEFKCVALEMENLRHVFASHR